MFTPTEPNVRNLHKGTYAPGLHTLTLQRKFHKSPSVWFRALRSHRRGEREAADTAVQALSLRGWVVLLLNPVPSLEGVGQHSCSCASEGCGHARPAVCGGPRAAQAYKPPGVSPPRCPDVRRCKQPNYALVDQQVGLPVAMPVQRWTSKVCRITSAMTNDRTALLVSLAMCDADLHISSGWFFRIYQFF